MPKIVWNYGKTLSYEKLPKSALKVQKIDRRYVLTVTLTYPLTNRKIKVTVDYTIVNLEHSDSYDLSTPEYKTGILPIKLQVQLKLDTSHQKRFTPKSSEEFRKIIFDIIGRRLQSGAWYGERSHSDSFTGSDAKPSHSSRHSSNKKGVLLNSFFDDLLKNNIYVMRQLWV